MTRRTFILAAMLLLVAMLVLVPVPAHAGGSGGLLPGNGWCGPYQVPIGTWCQSTAAVVDAARKTPGVERWLQAGFAVFSGFIITPAPIPQEPSQSPVVRKSN